MPRRRWCRSTSRADLPPERVRDALNFHTRPHPVAVLAAARGRAGLVAALLCHRARLSLPHPEPARAPGAGRSGASGMCSGGSMPAAMHEAAQGLLGRHDFSAFRAASCQAKSPLRTLDRLDVARLRRGDRDHRRGAQSFLHHQVRNLVGTLVEVGMGRRPESWPRAVLDGRDRAPRRPDRAARRADADRRALRPADRLGLTGQPAPIRSTSPDRNSASPRSSSTKPAARSPVHPQRRARREPLQPQRIAHRRQPQRIRHHAGQAEQHRQR